MRSSGAGGYFRIMPTDDGELHLIWKWTSGPLSQHYTYVFCGVADNWKMCIALLRQKRSECEQGLRKPTKDRWNDRH